MTTKKKFSIWWLLFITVLIAILVEFIHLGFLPATLLLFGLPAIYLTYKNPKLTKKAIIFMAIIVVPMTFIFDYLAYVDSSWFVPNSIFRFLSNAVPIEDAIWAILWVYYGVMFWEYFLDTEKTKRLFPKSIWNLVAFVAFLLIVFFTLYFLAPSYLYVSYFYLALGIIFGILPVGYVLWRYPRLLAKLLVIGAYFLVVSFLTEMVGLRQSHWYFAGSHYLESITVWGHRLPFDEILFWWILGMPAMICWYEFFADDRK